MSDLRSPGLLLQSHRSKDSKKMATVLNELIHVKDH